MAQDPADKSSYWIAQVPGSHACVRECEGPCQRALQKSPATSKIDLLKRLEQEALNAALPPGWVEHKTDEDAVYYFNADTKESSWEHPTDDYYRFLYKKMRKMRKQRQVPKAFCSLHPTLNPTPTPRPYTLPYTLPLHPTPTPYPYTLPLNPNPHP